MLHVNLTFAEFFVVCTNCSCSVCKFTRRWCIAHANRAENKRYWKSRVSMKYHPNGNLKNVMVFSAVANLLKNFTSVAVEFMATLANYICKRFTKLTPDWLRKCRVHTNAFSFSENAYISMRSGLPSIVTRWEFSESGSKWNRIHIVLVWTVENGKKRIKMKTMTENITGACVWSMRIEFNLCHNVQFYRFGTF